MGEELGQGLDDWHAGTGDRQKGGLESWPDTSPGVCAGQISGGHFRLAADRFSAGLAVMSRLPEALKEQHRVMCEINPATAIGQNTHSVTAA